MAMHHVTEEGKTPKSLSASNLHFCISSFLKNGHTHTQELFIAYLRVVATALLTQPARKKCLGSAISPITPQVGSEKTTLCTVNILGV